MKTANEKSRILKIETNDQKINMSQTASSIYDLAQYLRQDCFEITGTQPSADTTCVDVVCAVGKEMGYI